MKTIDELRQWVIDQTENEPEVRRKLLMLIEWYHINRRTCGDLPMFELGAKKAT